MFTSDDHRKYITDQLAVLPPELHPRAICKGCPHPTECRAKPCLNDLARPALYLNNRPSLMLPGEARAFEAALRAGKTARAITSAKHGSPDYICTIGKFKRHCEAYPAWGAEMSRLNDENVTANYTTRAQVHRRKVAGKCRKGHTLPAEPNDRRPNGRMYIRCVECARINKAAEHPPTMEVLGQVMVRLLQLHSVSSFTGGGRPGYLLSHASFTAARKRFPALDRLAVEVMAGSNRREQLRRAQENPRPKKPKPERKAKAPKVKAVIERSNIKTPALTGIVAGPRDPIFDAVCAAVPTRYPDEMRLEIIAGMALAVVDGSIMINDLSAKVGEFAREYNRNYPSKFAPPSLDAPAYRDSKTSLAETISTEQSIWI